MHGITSYCSKEVPEVLVDTFGPSPYICMEFLLLSSTPILQNQKEIFLYLCQTSNRRPKRHGFNPLEGSMAVHSTVFAWKTPRIEEPEGLQSIGSQRV